MSNEVMSPTQQGLGINPILTSVAQGYLNAEFVGSVLFPRVPVPNRHGQIIQFGKEAFKRYNARRAPGAATKRINVGYAGAPFVLVQDSLEAAVARENQQEAASLAGVDLAGVHVETTMEALLLGLEYEQAALARDASKYAVGAVLDGATATKWTDPASDPIADVLAARENVRSRIGRYPNTLVLAPTVFAALETHPKIVDRVKYTSSDSVSEAVLARLFKVETVKVAAAVIAADDTETLSDIWGKDAILAYVPTKVSSIIQPSYGYTYTLNGNPLVENAYWDQNTRSSVYGVTFERSAVMTSADSGFLFKNLV